MKIVFEALDNLTLQCKNAPSTRYQPDEQGTNRCVRAYMSMKGTLPFVDTDTEENKALTGLVKWMSDDDMLMDEWTVENFLRYEAYNYPASETMDPDTSWCSLLLTNDPVPEPAPEPEPPSEEELLAEAKRGRDSAIINARDAAIYSGIDVTTEYGDEHFTLNEKDKVLLLSIYAMVQAGMTSYPYHSVNTDSNTSNICAVYSDADIAKIATEAFAYVTYHESYANMLLQWLERETDRQVVYTIEYGATLPDDLQSYLEMVMTVAGVDTATIVPETGGLVDDPSISPEGL